MLSVAIIVCPVLEYLLNILCLSLDVSCLHKDLKIRAQTEVILVSWQRRVKQTLGFVFVQPTNYLRWLPSLWSHSARCVVLFRRCAHSEKENHKNCRIASTTMCYPARCVKLESCKSYFLTSRVKTTQLAGEGFFHAVYLPSKLLCPHAAWPSSVCTGGDLIKCVEGRAGSHFIHPRITPPKNSWNKVVNMTHNFSSQVLSVCLRVQTSSSGNQNVLPQPAALLTCVNYIKN